MIPETFQGDDGTWYRVTEIDYQAFQSCTNLATVTIPAGVKMIDTYAFSGCSNLTSVSLSEGVASIALEAFSNCTSLTSITIPDSVTTIGQSAFNYCTALTSITFEGTVEQWTAITKDFEWNGFPTTEVICSDGVISLD